MISFLKMMKLLIFGRAKTEQEQKPEVDGQAVIEKPLPEKPLTEKPKETKAVKIGYRASRKVRMARKRQRLARRITRRHKK